MLWMCISKFLTFYHFHSDPRFFPFLLYVRWKSGVTFVRRWFRDVSESVPIGAPNVGKDIYLFIYYENVVNIYTYIYKINIHMRQGLDLG